MKIAFISSLFGADRGNLPTVFKKIDGFDYFLFSDRDQSNFKTSWDVHDISKNENLTHLNCNIRKSRYAKFLGWELLESMGKNYDFIFYSDVHYSPNYDSDFKSLAEKVLNNPFPFCQDLHCANHIVQGGISAECNFIVQCKKDSRESISKTVRFFKKKFKDVNLHYPKYFENTMFGYSFHSKEYRKISKDFWNIYTTEDISFRDQPLWHVLMFHNNLEPYHKIKLRGDFFSKTGKYGNHYYT